MRQKLYDVRRRRKQPLLDTKILTSWNALMIRALAHGGQVLQEPRYIEAARRRPRRFLLAAPPLLRQRRHHPRRAADRPIGREVTRSGFLDDYAFLAQALLALADATGEAALARRGASTWRRS